MMVGKCCKHTCNLIKGAVTNSVDEVGKFTHGNTGLHVGGQIFFFCVVGWPLML